MSNIKRFSSRKEVTEFLKEKGIDTSNWSEEKWLKLNKGQAEIHLMDLAEKIYDVMNENSPKQLKADEWHIPFEDKIKEITRLRSNDALVQISTSMAARTSYTIVGEEKEVTDKKHIELHNNLITANPIHASPMEHCAKVMNKLEYVSYIKGLPDIQEFINDDDYGIAYHKTYEDNPEAGWCRNYKGFIQYRHILETK